MIQQKQKGLMGLLLIAAFFLVPLTALADRQLDAGVSNITFQSIKKGQVIETHSFRSYTGQLSDAGELKVVIDLASVDTKIPIRDERMRNSLFQVNQFPAATLTAKVDPSVLQQGGFVNTDATLDLHGVTQTIKVSAQVFRSGDALVAVSVEPVIIKAPDFGLEAGIEALRAMAGLPSITLQVPVSFTLVFR